MNVLITFSSGYGTTREIAESISGILKQEGEFKIEIKPIEQVEEVKSYEAVILGSSIRADKPLANTRDFMALYHHQLAHKKFAIFLVCLSAITPEGRDRVRRDYLPQILEPYPHIKPLKTGVLAGKIDFAKLNPVMQNLVRYTMEKLNVPVDGSLDARNWQAIEKWGRELRKELKKFESVTAR
jgi:menaquinone-dependent protoporphyrinogen IX oxidase